MRLSNLHPLAAVFLIAPVVGILSGTRAPAEEPDARNFANGLPIPDEEYCDQPRVVVTSDGAWVCVLTTGPGREGGEGQHIAAAASEDQGRTWSPLVDVEPAADGKKSSYALALIAPGDRIHAFYCYNGDGVKALPDGRPIRDDMQGWFCHRFSDDKGRNWSERRRLPMRVTAADRGNDWGGKLQMFWGIGTPAVFDGKVIFGFTKLGRYLLEEGEGWFFRSGNILAEKDPARIEWDLLPEGDHGVRAPELGTVQEEHDVVPLAGDDLFCVYRTALGHAACSYSRDGGRSWERPQALAYAAGGRIVKQPRACAKIWRTREGRFLLWYHNNGTTTYNNGSNAGSRNIAWLSGGRLEDGRLRWSQPEIAVYVDGGLEGCSYPDLIEDSGKYFICATQKTEARVMEVEGKLLEGLWNQDSGRELAADGLAVDLSGESCAAGSTASAPRLAPLSGEIRGRTPARGGRRGLSIDIAACFADLAPGQTLVDSRDAAGRGYALVTAGRGALRFEMSDGWSAAYWESDAGLIRENADHCVALIVDGGPKAILFVVDGILCDGGKERPFGFGRFSANFKDISGGPILRVAAALRGELKRLRIYDRPLRTTEAVANHRAGAR